MRTVSQHSPGITSSLKTQYWYEVGIAASHSHSKPLLSPIESQYPIHTRHNTIIKKYEMFHEVPFEKKNQLTILH